MRFGQKIWIFYYWPIFEHGPFFLTQSLKKISYHFKSIRQPQQDIIGHLRKDRNTFQEIQFFFNFLHSSLHHNLLENTTIQRPYFTRNQSWKQFNSILFRYLFLTRLRQSLSTSDLSFSLVIRSRKKDTEKKVFEAEAVGRVWEMFSRFPFFLLR